MGIQIAHLLKCKAALVHRTLVGFLASVRAHVVSHSPGVASFVLTKVALIVHRAQSPVEIPHIFSQFAALGQFVWRVLWAPKSEGLVVHKTPMFEPKFQFQQLSVNIMCVSDVGKHCSTAVRAVIAAKHRTLQIVVKSVVLSFHLKRLAVFS